MTPVFTDFAGLVEKITNFLEKDPSVIFAVVFGSAAAAKMREKSDLDLGVYFANPPEGLDLLDFINGASNAAGRDVDVVVLNSASAFLRHQAMKTKINLLIRDYRAFRRFREKTISDYEEYKFISGMDIYDR